MDQHRPEWERQHPKAWEEVGLVEGRGGRTLLTLADAFRARRALRGSPIPEVPARIDQDACCAGRVRGGHAKNCTCT